MDSPSFLSDKAFATIATIRLDHLRHNLNIFRRAAPGIDIMAVVKADAYGHGSIQVASALIREGVSFLAVATVPEGIELRKAGISERILVFGAPRKYSAHFYDEFDLEATVTGTESLAELKSVSSVKVHINLDTGMGRVGLQVNELEQTIRRIEKSQHLELVGLATHFSTAGNPDSEFTAEQWSRFIKAIDLFGSAPAEIHAASSGAVFNVPESINPNFVTTARVGVGLYGLLDIPDETIEDSFRPVMTLKSEVSHIKNVLPGTPISYKGTWCAPGNTQIASVAAGYADGVPRHLSNLGVVSIGGESYPIVGSICMDMFMVDIGRQADRPTPVYPGDTVILFGEGGPSAIDVARAVGTIPYEIVCGIGNRVPRIYTDGNTE